MSQQITTDTDQYISNKSFDPTFNLEMVVLCGYDASAGVMRPFAVDSSGNLI